MVQQVPVVVLHCWVPLVTSIIVVSEGIVGSGGFVVKELLTWRDAC